MVKCNYIENLGKNLWDVYSKETKQAMRIF